MKRIPLITLSHFLLLVIGCVYLPEGYFE